MCIRKACLTIVVLCVLFLAGCQCSHEWVEADCTTPKTCSLCGETEGEPIGHTWVEASCTAPKTCSVCGETEGEALPHTWVEPNYQDPKTCSVCGATEGEPLTASFRQHEIEINLYENKHRYTDNSSTQRDPFALVTTCNDGIHKTTGDLYVCDYRIFESDETHLPVSGYEWRAVDFIAEFSDENVIKYGGSFQFACCDFYSTGDEEALEEDYSAFDVSDSEWDYLSDTAFGFYVNYHGEDYPCVRTTNTNVETEYRYKMDRENEKKKVYVVTISVYCCEPIGYDGVVLMLYDTANRGGSDGARFYDVIDENTLFFRMENDPEKWWER